MGAPCLHLQTNQLVLPPASSFANQSWDCALCEMVKLLRFPCSFQLERGLCQGTSLLLLWGWCHNAYVGKMSIMLCRAYPCQGVWSDRCTKQGSLSFSRTFQPYPSICHFKCLMTLVFRFCIMMFQQLVLIGLEFQDYLSLRTHARNEKSIATDTFYFIIYFITCLPLFHYMFTKQAVSRWLTSSSYKIQYKEKLNHCQCS